MTWLTWTKSRWGLRSQTYRLSDDFDVLLTQLCLLCVRRGLWTLLWVVKHLTGVIRSTRLPLHLWPFLAYTCVGAFHLLVLLAFSFTAGTFLVQYVVYRGQSLPRFQWVTRGCCLHRELVSPYFVLLVQFIFAISGFEFIRKGVEWVQLVLKTPFETGR